MTNWEKREASDLVTWNYHSREGDTGLWRGPYDPASVEVVKLELTAETTLIADGVLTLVSYVAPVTPDTPTNTQLVAGTDMAYVRVLEDLIDALILNSTILLTDLPQAAQDKHTYRLSLRS